MGQPRFPSVPACALALTLSLLAAPSARAYSPQHPGKWTTDDLWPSTAVNMVLLPDSAGPFKARIVWWQDSDDQAPTHGGVWGWTPVSNDEMTSGTFPGSHFSEFTLPPAAGNIFCSGMSHLANGQLLVTGGTDYGEVGMRNARIFDPANNQWLGVPDMKWRRWYPTSTFLPDGKALITSGSQFQTFRVFGGARPYAEGDSIARYPLTPDNDYWISSARPAADITPGSPGRPAQVEGASAATGLGDEVIFGGMTPDSVFTNASWELYRQSSRSGGDYGYEWRFWPLDPSAPAPVARAYQSLASITPCANCANYVVALGGRSKGDPPGLPPGVLGDMWLGVIASGRISWTPLTQSGDLPASGTRQRYGHAAVWNADLRRLFVYGGARYLGAAPDDPDVYSVQIDVNAPTAVWTRCTLQSGSATPSPRMNFASDITRDAYPRVANGPAYRRMFVFGGRRADGAVTNDLYSLWMVDSVTVRWDVMAQSGAVPAAREFASGTDAGKATEFFVMGGQHADGSGDNTLASFDYNDTCYCDSAGWNALPASWAPLRGQAVVYDQSDLFTRFPELYDPASNSFTEFTNQPILQDWYPQTFVLPGGSPWSLFYSGPSDTTYRFTVSNDATYHWTAVGSSGFRGGSSVMYRVGKVMKCGSRDTDPFHSDAVGTTKSIDLTVASPTWAACPDTMDHRVNHNLTILPDGRVLVTGGMRIVADAENKTSVGEPEIWDPDMNNGLGAWVGRGYLNPSSLRKGYHSTTLLLPDGSVLCAGGAFMDNAAENFDQRRANIYYPPYLFNADSTPANRPKINSVPARIEYAGRFTVCVAGDTTGVASIVLIRPGAVTHGFDQDQRYVPLARSLAATTAGVEERFDVTAPGDSSLAPPGDYLLFVVNNQGTPSIASWVRLASINGDSAHPERVTSLAKVCSHGDNVDLQWNPPSADDSVTTCVGPASAYELRYQTSSMSTWALFQAGSPGSVPAQPGEPGAGNWDQTNVSGLTPETHYYFRLISRNDANRYGNWSAMSNELDLVTHYEDCGGLGGGGGGGGGFIATRGGGPTQLIGGGASATGFVENTLLADVRPGVTATDRLRLPLGPLMTGAGGASVRLSRSGERGTLVQRVRLLAVDHASGDETFADGSSFATGGRVAAASVTRASGADLTASLAADTAFDGREGDTLLVRFKAADASPLLLTTSRSHLVVYPDSTGILVQVPQGDGWVPVGRVSPRDGVSDALVELPATDRVRLVFLGVHRLHRVARLAASGTAASVSAFEPVSATLSSGGDALAALASGGVTLSAGSAVVSDFSPTPVASGLVRDWYLEVTGEHLALTTDAGAAAAARPGSALPARFALLPSVPNPTRGSATLRFDLPVDASVRLEIFDLLGRRIATVADGRLAAGHHSLAWDRRTSAGGFAPPGVYRCRMIAGAFRDQRSIVLLP